MLFFFSLSRQAFSESLAAQDAGDQDGERDEDGPHRVQEDRLLAEVHVLLSELRDDNIADSVQSSGAEKKITMKILLLSRSGPGPFLVNTSQIFTYVLTEYVGFFYAPLLCSTYVLYVQFSNSYFIF